MNPSPARGTDACNAPIPPNVIRAADVHAGNSTTAREKMKKVSKNTDQNKAAGMVFAQQTITTDWSKHSSKSNAPYSTPDIVDSVATIFYSA
ncbi:hypothetical protein Y032_0031g2300 [Ancylostoma ceylanicum]|uniref:Uncharacterized protein n=1 Tax=Ancylostoma ceylanicum TaxID=53326 RepID=A0A016UQP8_9BILA|nr:hypothetical protein Y032_0031g2300 [Ancylostoma ceylanicum]